MLTKETKDRIDRARQILVGQLPLPSDQIELITIALIYKFMDDMDEQSRDLGGQASFFVGKLRDYGWREIIANKLDAKERVDRFVKGVELLSDPKDNPVPDLFQSIFRNTFLKFRDGRTLKLFLDEINGFTYDHSEELGNAFEYLLDCMGTQADNGQFRTPRHIIDFIVAAVDPKLGQTILDPACGTAGFLISAFRHIIAANTSEPENGRARRPGDRLTAEQRQQLTHDIVGFDITPQMARLSRVNMYLHQFASPVIHEYDTITNTSRWDEKFDVVLANPPFMSPHGGNQPHDKFQIPANRTEVLFADYILEHLLPNGRAGFIVPEGIIFQNQGDYVSLRKWLIEEGGLWAVASLPAGVFQPYSGVKTSVLFVDRALARKRSDVLLLKIENDGFSLNTNRNPIAENDLPTALALLRAAKSDDYAAQLAALASPLTHRVVSRADFAQLDAYRSGAAAWDFCCKRHARLRKAEADLAALRADADADARVVARTERAVAKLREDFPTDTGLPTIPTDEAGLKVEFETRVKSNALAYGDDPKTPTTLASALRECIDAQRTYSLSMEQEATTSAQRSAFETVRIEEIAKIVRGSSPRPKADPRFYGGPIPRLMVSDLTRDGMYVTPRIDSLTVEGAEYSRPMNRGDVVMAVSGNPGLAAILAVDACIHDGFVGFRSLDTSRILPEFFYFVLRHLKETNGAQAVGAIFKNLTTDQVANFVIPVPPLPEQRAIVVEIESYQRVVDGCAAVLAGYSPMLKMEPDWAHERIGDLCDLINGRAFKPTDWEPKEKGGLPIIRIQNLNNPDAEFNYYSGDVLPKLLVEPGDLLFSWSGSRGTSFGPHIWRRERGILNQHIFNVIHDDRLDRTFFYLALKHAVAEVEENLHGGVGLVHITKEKLCKIKVPVPPMNVQRLIAAELHREQATLAGVAELKAKHEARIRTRLATVWGEENDAAPQPVAPAESVPATAAA